MTVRELIEKLQQCENQDALARIEYQESDSDVLTQLDVSNVVENEAEVLIQ
jgi:hypothetical protein